MISLKSHWPSRSLLGVTVQALTMDEVLSIVAETIRNRGRLLIGVVNAAKLVNMRRDECLSDAVRSADLLLADGMSVVWASRLLRRPVPERVAGIDLMRRMLEKGDRHGYRVYCLGAAEEVLSEAVARIREDYPRVVIVGRHHGYYAEADEPRIAAEITAARPDILLAGMSSPKKERFLARWAPEMNVPVCHGVGGAFDVLAGKVKRAPRSWQRCGMEWLYRVIQEPGRMWRRYLVTNTLFCGMVAAELIAGLRPPQREA